MAEQTENRIKIGLAGLGGHGRTIRNAIDQSGCFEVVGVFDPNQEEAAAASSQFGCGIAPSFEALLDIEGIEGISLVTPNKLHLAEIEQATAKGLHIFVEKPITVTVDEAHKAVALSQASGKILMVGQNMRYGRTARLAKEYIESGKLGQLTSLEIHFSSPSLRFMPEGSWRFQTVMLPMVQLGIHAIDLVHFWLGDVTNVSATARSLHTSEGIYDNIVAMFKLHDGLLGTMVSNYNTQVAFLLHLAGTEGSLRCTPHKLWFRRTDQTDGNGEGEAEEHDFTAFNAESYLRQMKAFAEAIRTNTQPETDVIAGFKALAVVEAMQESIQDGQWKKVRSYE
jgi:predicted dehydrogenase